MESRRMIGSWSSLGWILLCVLTPRFDAVETTRKVEEFVRSVNGFQMMYADSYMTRAEFREMFDHKLYDEMRSKLKCVGNFPEVYDKVNKKSRAGN